MMRAVGLVLMAILLCVGPAAAAPKAAEPAMAPQYSSSEPEDGAKMHQAPDVVTVTFSEPLNESSEMIVEDHCGQRIDDGNVQVSVNEMSVGIEDKPSGHYMVTYAADGVGGVTGTTNGRFGFEVHAGKPCDGSSQGDHGGHGGDHGSENGGQGGHQDGGHQGGGGRPGAEHSGGEADHGRNDDGSAGQHSDSGHMSGAGRSAGAPHSKHSTGASANDPNPAGGNDAGASDRKGSQADESLNEIASGQTPLPVLDPDSTAVLLALLLCAAFGGLGGWLLRVSAQR